MLNKLLKFTEWSEQNEGKLDESYRNDVFEFEKRVSMGNADDDEGMASWNEWLKGEYECYVEDLKDNS